MATFRNESKIARQLVLQAGLTDDVVELRRLKGGRNNRVFKVTLANGECAVLKLYFVHSNDPRDRLAAEWGFLTRVWSQGIRNIPQPLAIDRMAHAALLAYVPGHVLSDAEIVQEHVDAAADFVAATNNPRQYSLAPASEACFSLAQHLATVEYRVHAFETLGPQALPAAGHFVREHLGPAWATIRTRIEKKAAGAGFSRRSALDDDQIVLSPSDFGFHNAIMGADGGLAFIDFEYAGRDDPAKLVCDFLCQPSVLVPHNLGVHFVQRIAHDLSDSSLVGRAELLLDAYRIKWICIILNELLPLGAARRAFAADDGGEDQCAIRLAAAQARLAEITL